MARQLGKTTGAAPAPLATAARPPAEPPPLPPGTTLRPGTAADARALAAVFVSAWRAGYVGIVDQAVLDDLDEGDIAEWLRVLTLSHDPETWVAETAGQGTVAFSRYGADPVDSRRGHIYSLYVAPAASGRGIGKALVAHGLRLLADRGFGTVTLWVFEKNEAARRLYASFGFVADGAHRVEPEYGAPEVRLRSRLRGPQHAGAPAVPASTLRRGDGE